MIKRRIFIMYSVEILTAVLFASYILVVHINLNTYILSIFVLVVLFMDLVLYFPFIASSKFFQFKDTDSVFESFEDNAA